MTAGFHTGFLVGGELFFGTAKLILSEGVWGHCPEIESGGFWQLADCSQVPITYVMYNIIAIFSSSKAIKSLFFIVQAPPFRRVGNSCTSSV